MNIHQLELFYHVTLHRGVSRAAKALDKEQPTLSKQINDLENQLRVKLYHRRPFRLTEPGETLFRGIEPFFRELPRLEEQVRGGDTLRIGSSPVVLMDHLPAIEKVVRKQFPKLRLVLLEAGQLQLLQWLDHGEIDLAITLLPEELPQKMFGKLLLEVPLILLVPKGHRLKTAKTLWQQPKIREKLICLTPDELVCRKFQQELKTRNVEWRPEIEAGSLDLIEHYVRQNYGVGLSVRLPGMRLSPKLRILEMPDFPSVPVGILWRDNEDKLVRALREQVEKRAAQFLIKN